MMAGPESVLPGVRLARCSTGVLTRPPGNHTPRRCSPSPGPRASRSSVASATSGLAKGRWRVVSASAQAPGGGDATRAIDGDPRTLWHTHTGEREIPVPQEIVVDLGEVVDVTAFLYLPRQDGITNGVVDRYELYLCSDGKSWGEPVVAGEFGNLRANPVLQVIPLPKTTRARTFRFVATHVLSHEHIAVAELGVRVRR